MSPRIAFWTSAFDAHMEAIASEVALLRQRFPCSVSWGLHPSHRMMLSRQRGFCLHPRMHLLFRGLTRLAEPFFQLNHIYGSTSDWFYLSGVRTRPTVLTVAATGVAVDRNLLERVDYFAVEYPAGRDELRALGVDKNCIELVLPPVDLNRFRPTSRPDGPFTILFASSPENPDWFEARGVTLLLEAAALRPQYRFRLLWRPWGRSLPIIEREIRQRELTNVDLVTGCISDMPTEFHRTHVTIAPFTQRDRCKPAPNSLIESLACGRPVLCTSEVEIADLIHETGCGNVCPTNAQAVAESLDSLESDWETLSYCSRFVAESYFAQDRFLSDYERIYGNLIGTSKGRAIVSGPSDSRPARRQTSPANPIIGGSS